MARTAYNPAQDNQLGSDPSLTPEFAAQINREHNAVVLGRQPGDCLCGCGLYPSGKKSEFRPGHDARLKGILQRAYRNGAKIAEVVDGDVRISDPVEDAKNRGWVKFLAAPAKKTAPTAPKAPATRSFAVGDQVQVRVGRWEYPGTIEAIQGRDYQVAYKNRKGSPFTTVVRKSALQAA